MAKNAIVITCEDCRLHERPKGGNHTAEFTTDHDLYAYVITRAGGILDLARPTETGFDRSLLKDISIPVKKKGISEIYLLNHENCAAYPDFPSRNEEIIQHLEDLARAAEIIKAKFTGANVHLHFGDLVSKENELFDFGVEV